MAAKCVFGQVVKQICVYSFTLFVKHFILRSWFKDTCIKIECPWRKARKATSCIWIYFFTDWWGDWLTFEFKSHRGLAQIVSKWRCKLKALLKCLFTGSRFWCLFIYLKTSWIFYPQSLKIGRQWIFACIFKVGLNRLSSFCESTWILFTLCNNIWMFYLHLDHWQSCCFLLYLFISTHTAITFNVF